jgi:hypothetical protein
MTFGAIKLKQKKKQNKQANKQTSKQTIKLHRHNHNLAGQRAFGNLLKAVLNSKKLKAPSTKQHKHPNC